MTVAADLRQAAIDVFDALTGVPIVANYIVVDSAPYVAGGDLTKNETTHSIRMIREERSELAMAVADDISSKIEKWLFVKSELPVDVQKNDRVEFGAEVFIVDDFENDAVDAVTTIFLKSA